MKSLWKLAPAALACICLMPPAGSAAPAAPGMTPARPATDVQGEWKEYREGFKYESAVFSCSIRPDGTIRDIRTSDGIIVEGLFIHGTYKPRDKHDSRFFQSQSKGDTPLKVMKTGENAFVVKKDGILRNKRYDRAARYAERVTVRPEGLVFEYEVELLVELASNHMIFIVLQRIPSATLANRGCRMVSVGGSEKLRVFPGGYEEWSAVRASGLREFSVLLDRHYFSFLAGDGTTMSLQDTRAWGGKGYRLNVGQATPWRPEPVSYPAGTEFRWSFKLTFLERD